MNIYIKGHSFKYEIENVARLFTDEVKIFEGPVPKESRDGDFAYLKRIIKNSSWLLLCMVQIKGVRLAKTAETLI